MSPDVIISVSNLGKKYRISHQGDQPHYTALRDVLAEKAKGLLAKLKFGRRQAETNNAEGQNQPQISALPGSSPRAYASSEDFWALKDVSFEIKRGEVVGVIGRNGAGKSTLLKVLSRITEPTTGRVHLKGRVASLLEVGTGFHPELTGRENVFLNGAILGMSRVEIRRKFDEIVAFAEVEKFLDTPVKRYSSGMYVRLAFAVAAHLEPEILIVDEVLAVGDFGFQQKCLGKMQKVAGEEGRTVLFVSHNMQAVTTLCNRAILLNAGQVRLVGSSFDVSNAYHKMTDGSEGQIQWRGDSGDDTFRLKMVRAVNNQSGVFFTDEILRIQMVASVQKPIAGLIFAMEVYSGNNQLLAYSSHDDCLPPPAHRIEPGDFSWEMAIPANTFAAGTYEFRTDIGIHNGKRLVEERVSLTIAIENSKGIGRRFPGWKNCFRPEWSWRRLAASEIKPASRAADRRDLSEIQTQ